jgi:hypothetical protein
MPARMRRHALASPQTWAGVEQTLGADVQRNKDRILHCASEVRSTCDCRGQICFYFCPVRLVVVTVRSIAAIRYEDLTVHESTRSVLLTKITKFIE